MAHDLNRNQLFANARFLSLHRTGWEVLFAVAEERLSRVKHDARFPELAIRACLDHVSVHAKINWISSASDGLPSVFPFVTI